jgi:hypothetical protein
VRWEKQNLPLRHGGTEKKGIEEKADSPPLPQFLCLSKVLDWRILTAIQFSKISALRLSGSRYLLLAAPTIAGDEIAVNAWSMMRMASSTSAFEMFSGGDVRITFP